MDRRERALSRALDRGVGVKIVQIRKVRWGLDGGVCMVYGVPKKESVSKERTGTERRTSCNGERSTDTRGRGSNTKERR